MCGRYVSPDEASIEREFNLVHQDWQFPSSFNIAPTQQCRFFVRSMELIGSLRSQRLRVSHITVSGASFSGVPGGPLPEER